MTDTPLKPEPVAWAERRELDRVKPGAARGCLLAKTPLIGDGWNFNVPLYTRDQLDAAVRAERERLLSHIDGLIETLQEGLMTDAGLSKLDRQKMRAQIDALDVAAAAIREGE